MRPRRAPRVPIVVRAVAVLAGLSLGLTACGSDAPTAAPAPADDWEAVLAQADGQSVNWYMYGGDDALNAFVEGEVSDRLAALGVTLNQVRITDTADAVNKVLGEQQAGRTSGGAVDAIWVNGENFATGIQADLWRCGWAQDLPNAQYVDLESPAVATDFGVPTNGCEAAWQQANSALVYDSADLDPADVESVSSLVAWARANPGRFTYPAPPDFTGSMAVRTFLYDTVGGSDTLAGEFDEAAYTPAAGALWQRLNALEPALWRGGETYPQSQSAVEKLYADGEISAFFTYGPGAVSKQVEDGLFPESTREAVLAGGNISNVSFLAIPANAAHQAAALVLANVLQEPEVQLELFRATGVYPAIDLTRLDASLRRAFEQVPLGRSVLSPAELTANAQAELASGYLQRIEKDWASEVLQR